MDAVTQNQSDKQWFYESEGQCKGGVPEVEIITLIKEGKLTHGAAVWCKGMPDWMRIENTDLRVHLDDSAPPPLTGEHVNNTLVWVLAFAPVLGFILEGLVAGFVYHGNDHLVELAMAHNKFWYVTIALNIGLSFWDAGPPHSECIADKRHKRMFAPAANLLFTIRLCPSPT